uniref:DNA topoisomerase n=1 Tax=Mesocestoides corti TaxID=53468 RepID=A0A5K3EW34_MESCO
MDPPPIAHLPGRRLPTGGEGELFEAKGLVIHGRNYLEVYTYESWSERFMPNFQLGEIITPDKIEIMEGRTSPPSLLTEADLIALMDKYGIGTDATHAEHIETIKKRMYVGLQDGKFLVPSQLGMGLVEGYDAMDLAVAKPCLRADLETDLKAICEGRKDKDEVLRTQLAKYKSAFEMVMREARKLDVAIGRHLSQEAANIPDDNPESAAAGGTGYHNLCKCPSCGRDVVIRKRNPQENQPPTAAQSNRMSWFLSCTGFPNCRYAIWLPDSIVAARVIENLDGVRNERSQISPCLPCSSPTGCQGGGRFVGLKFRLGTLLPSGYIQEDADMEYVTCLFCDEEFRMAFGIRTVPAPSQPTQPPRASPAHHHNTSTSVPNRGFSTITPAAHNHRQPRNPPAVPLRPFGGALSTNSGQSGGCVGPDESNPVICGCGIPARLLTVKKPGPNQGKKFYKCGDSSDVCNFFLWQERCDPSVSDFSISSGDQNASSASASWRPSSSSRTSVSGDSGFVQSGEVLCSCGLPTVLKTVSQQTVNKGRQFYVCPNSNPGDHSSGCRFFQWADTANPAGGSQGRGGPRGRGRGGYQSRSAPIASPSVAEGWPPSGPTTFSSAASRRGGGIRKCGLCHLPGHTRNRCPSALRE